LENLISYEEKYINIKLKTYNKMNGIIKRYFGSCMTTDTKVRLHKITSKTALFYGSETWTIKNRDAQRMEAAQMRYLMLLPPKEL
jgi:hypothetical protein